MADIRKIFEQYKEGNGRTIALDGRVYSVVAMKECSGLFLVRYDNEHCLLVTPEEELINYWNFNGYIEYIGAHRQFLLFRDREQFYLYDIKRKKYIFSKFTNNDSNDPRDPLGYYRYHTDNDDLLITNAFISYGVNPEDGKHYLFDSKFCENGEPLGPYDSIEWLNYYYHHEIHRTYLKKYFVFTRGGKKTIYCKGIGFIAEKLYGNKIINITRPRGVHEGATGFGACELIITTQSKTGEELQYLCEIKTHEYIEGTRGRYEWVDFENPRLVSTVNMKAPQINLCSKDHNLYSLTTDGITEVRTKFGELRFKYECEEIVALFGWVVDPKFKYYKFKKNGMWGILHCDKDGNVECILDAQYEEIDSCSSKYFDNHKIFVLKKGNETGYFVIGDEHRFVVQPQYPKTYSIQEEYHKVGEYAFFIVTLPSGKKAIFRNKIINDILKEETGLDEFDEIEITNSNHLLFYAKDSETETIWLYVYDLNNPESNLVTMPALTDSQRKLSKVPFVLGPQQSPPNVLGDLKLNKPCCRKRYFRNLTRKTE